MKTLRLTALAVVLLTLLVWGCHSFISPLPDWTLRVNGVIMLAGAVFLVFASVRLIYKQHTRKEN